MLNPLGENPPPDKVEKELHTASNPGIPKAIKAITSNIVRKIYTPQRAVAVCLILGVIFSSVGPGASAKNICLPATLN